MKVHELIALLEEVDDRDAEVQLAMQPSWPLAFEIAGMATPRDMAEAVADEDDEYEEGYGEHDGVVWLAAGGHPHHPYAPNEVWNAARRW